MGRKTKTRVSRNDYDNDHEIGGSGEPIAKEKSLYEVIQIHLSLSPPLIYSIFVYFQLVIFPFSVIDAKGVKSSLCFFACYSKFH